MNNFKVTINGTHYTNAVFPFKYGEFLDEQLDYATLTLSRVSTEIFAPLTPVTVEIISRGTNGTQTKTKNYIIANDDGRETPNGSGFYRHELTLVEETKYLEGFMVESLCVTNAGGRNYTQMSPRVIANDGLDGAFIPKSPDSLYTPLIIGESVALPPVSDFIGTEQQIGNIETEGSYVRIDFSDGTTEQFTIKSSVDGAVNESFVVKSGMNNVTYHLNYYRKGSTALNTGELYFIIYGQPNKYSLKPWTIKEVINRALELVEPLVWDESATREETQETSMMVTLSGNPPSFSNTGSISRGKITSAVITNRDIFLQYRIRLLITHTDTTYTVTASAASGTIVPILAAEIKLTVEQQTGNYVVPPRFQFAYKDPTDAEEIALFEQYSPEFTFTRCTLRELLQEIGGYIHAEPRLSGNTITFDRYGGQELATYYDVNKKAITNLNEYNYCGKEISYGIEQALTKIDSYVDNLVNQINSLRATVGQPYSNGYQTLRVDSSYIRLEENEGTIFPSVFPILKVEKFYWTDTNTGTKYDITPYLFEKSIYDSQLSSYTDVYPASKCYALYYTQGDTNIGGFFFKVPNPVSPVFEQYAIVNILRAVTGNDSLTVSDYAKLCFELVYTPIYSARVNHGKQYLGDLLKNPRTIAHNQSANQVETQYYGENIKGLAERLGNIEKSYTFHAMNIETIPKAGQLWDDDYYISTVAVEVNFDRFVCTVGLTKNFNRKSKYIGANSYRRIYEISERMVQERQSIYTDYLVVTDRESPAPKYAKNMFCHQYNFFNNLVQTFLQSSANATIKISSALIQGKTKNGKETLPQVILPVIASAFGNVMEFSWEFKDNFSAGQRIVYQSNDGPEGYFTTEVQYCDYYGRMYYEDVILCSTLATACDPESFPLYEELGSNGPIKMIKLPENCTIIKRKDSREALKENYSVEFNTDIKGVIIGSALPANNPLVSGLNPKAKAKLVILRTPVNKFSRKVNLSTENIAAEYEVTDNMIRLNAVDKVYCAEADGITATTDGKAWAYVTPIYEGDSYTVEDEDGNVETITPSYGGELLIGRNIEIASGDTIGAFRIFPTHDVFEYMKEKHKPGGINMNFYVDSGGTILGVEPEKIYQGSANANTIRFIGAFASNAKVMVAFKLPTGVLTTPQLMTASTQLKGVVTVDGVQFNVWEYSIPALVTETFGTVDLQFFVYGDAGDGNGGTIATASSSFEVERGVPITLPDPTDDYETLLRQIISALSQIQGELKFDDMPTIGSKNLVTSDGIGKAVNEKLDKSTVATNYPQAYVKNADGTQSVNTYTSILYPGGIVSRDNTSHFDIPDPTQAAHSVNLKYYNENVPIAVQEGFATQTALVNTQRQVDGLYTLLEQKGEIYVQTATDTYTTRETAGGENIADGVQTPVKKITGSTVASENLISYKDLYNGKGYNNSSYTKNEDESISISLATYDNIAYSDAFYLNTGEYTISADIKSDSDFLRFFGFRVCKIENINANPQPPGEVINTITSTNITNSYTRYSNTFTVSEGGYYAYNIQMSGDESHARAPLTFKDIQINKGSTAKPYKPYFPGLKNAFIKEIVSTGRNLFGLTAEDFKNGEIFGEGKRVALKLEPNTQYTLSSNTPLYSDNAASIWFNGPATGTDGIWINQPRTTTTDENGELYITIRTTEIDTIFEKYWLMLNYGSSALSYESYTQSVLSLPEAVELTEYDTAYPETGEIQRQSNTLTFDGTEGWSFDDTAVSSWYLFTHNIRPNYGESDTSIISNKLPTRNGGGDYGMYMAGRTNGHPNSVYIYFDKTVYPNFSTVEAWKAQLATWAKEGDPLTVTYKTAEVQSTEQADFSADSYIAWKNGSETIKQGDTDNSIYGAENTVEQDYYLLTAPEEVTKE